jgi:hypothetical protein
MRNRQRQAWFRPVSRAGTMRSLVAMLSKATVAEILLGIEPGQLIPSCTPQFQVPSYLHQGRIPVAAYRFRLGPVPVDLRIGSYPN